jgi:hypothetical protein
LTHIIDIQAHVRNFAAEIFGRDAVARVVVNPDFGATGSEILRIYVVFKENPRTKLKADDVANLNEKIRDYLVLDGDSRFPVVVFLTSDELRKINAE